MSIVDKLDTFLWYCTFKEKDVKDINKKTVLKVLLSPFSDAFFVEQVSTSWSHDKIRVTEELLTDRTLYTHCMALKTKPIAFTNLKR
jgi:hypothetical protein